MARRRQAASDVLDWPRPARPLADLPLLLAAWLRPLIEAEIARRTPFLWLPVAFSLGILVYFAAPEEPLPWAGAALGLLLIALAVLSAGIARALLLAMAFAAAGFAASSFRTFLVASPMLERQGQHVVRGIVEQVDSLPRRHRLVVRPLAIEGIAEVALPFRLRIGAPGPAEIAAGDHVKLTARLGPPSEAAMPGGYDFRRAAFFASTGGVGYTLGRPEKLDAPGPLPFWLSLNAAIDRWRNLVTERIARTIGGEAGALSAALVTGKRGMIAEETNDDLRASGLYHIVSISGLHMVLAAGVLFWILRAALAAVPWLALHWPIKKLAAAFAMLGASFYCLFSGSEVATERSLIMTLVMLGAILFDRPALAMRNLALSALLVLAREPEALLGPSFQMSFAAVAGLIAANQIWQTRPRRASGRENGPVRRAMLKFALAFAAIIATTIVATLATAPFSAYHFHRLNPFGLIGNSLAIPLVSIVVMPAAVAGALAFPFGLDSLVWKVMGEGVAGVLFVAAKVAAFENAVWPVARMSDAAFALIVAALLLFVGLQTRLRLFALPVLAGWFAVSGPAPLPDLVVDPSGRMVLIRAPGGAYRLLSVGSANAFTLSQWLPSLGDARSPRDPSLREGIRCDRSGCVGRLADGRRVALSLRLEALREDCRRADIVITPLLAGSLCPAPRQTLDRRHFDAYGATRIETPKPGLWRLATTLDPAQPRPWRRPARLIPAEPPTRSPAPTTTNPPNSLSDDPSLAPQ